MRCWKEGMQREEYVLCKIELIPIIRGETWDFPEGGGEFFAPGKISHPPPKLILCEIYHLISSFCLKKNQKKKGYQTQWGGEKFI